MLPQRFHPLTVGPALCSGAALFQDSLLAGWQALGVFPSIKEEDSGGAVFPEPHGNEIADGDGDGVPDFIVGKRYRSDLGDYYDPDPYGADIVTSTRSGTSIFWGESSSQKHKQ